MDKDKGQLKLILHKDLYNPLRENEILFVESLVTLDGIHKIAERLCLQRKAGRVRTMKEFFFF